MPGDLLIRHARAVLADRVLPEAHVRVAGGRITLVCPDPLEPQPDEPILDAAGLWLLPGLVDTHCDAIEREVQPRPGVMLPPDLALVELDRKLALAGVTTMFHGVSFGAGVGVRSNDGAAALVRAVARFAVGATLVRHRVHLRLEVTNWRALDLVAELVAEGAVGLLSFMDHTPGQGQYTDPRRFREYVRKTYGVDESEVDRIIREHIDGRQRVADDDLARLAAMARAAGIPVAGHDPDTPAAVDAALARGTSLMEFPVAMEAARYARERGLHISVGAPNVLHGRSHDGNLSARDAIAAGVADVLCSDYYPAGLLHAVFQLEALGLRSLPEAASLASRHAAAAAGLGDVAGAIEPGRWGDLLLVSKAGGRPAVAATVVAGTVVLRTALRSSVASTPLVMHPGAFTP